MHTRRQVRTEQTAVERRMHWKTLLVHITGMVDQALLLRNQITGRVRLTDGERKALADISQQLGKKALEEVAKVVEPDTILCWHRNLVAPQFDGLRQRQAPGRPKIDQPWRRSACRGSSCLGKRRSAMR